MAPVPAPFPLEILAGDFHPSVSDTTNATMPSAISEALMLWSALILPLLLFIVCVAIAGFLLMEGLDYLAMWDSQRDESEQRPLTREEWRRQNMSRGYQYGAMDEDNGTWREEQLPRYEVVIPMPPQYEDVYGQPPAYEEGYAVEVDVELRYELVYEDEEPPEYAVFLGQNRL